MFESYLSFNYNFLAFDEIFNSLPYDKTKDDIFKEFGKIVNYVVDNKNDIKITTIIEYNLFYFLTKDDIKNFLNKNSKSDNVYLVSKMFNKNYNKDFTLTYNQVKKFYPFFEQNKLKEKHIDILNFNERKKFDFENIELFLSSGNDQYFNSNKDRTKLLLGNFLRNNTLTTEQLKKVLFRRLEPKNFSDLEVLQEVIRYNILLQQLSKIVSINESLLTYENLIKLNRKELKHIISYYYLKEDVIKRLYETKKKIILNYLYIYKKDFLDLKEKNYIENNNILTEKELISFKELSINEINIILEESIKNIFIEDKNISKYNLNNILILIKKQKLTDKHIIDIASLKIKILTNTLLQSLKINEQIIKENIKLFPILYVLNYQNISKDLLKHLLEKKLLTTFKHFEIIMYNSKYKNLNNLITNRLLELKNKKLKNDRYNLNNLFNKKNEKINRFYDNYIINLFNKKNEKINRFYDNSIINYPFLNQEMISDYLKCKKEIKEDITQKIYEKEFISSKDMESLLSTDLKILKNITTNFNFFIKNKDKTVLDKIYFILKNSKILGKWNYNEENDFFVIILQLALIEVFRKNNLEIYNEIVYDFNTKENFRNQYVFKKFKYLEDEKKPLKFLNNNDISLI